MTLEQLVDRIHAAVVNAVNSDPEMDKLVAELREHGQGLSIDLMIVPEEVGKGVQSKGRARVSPAKFDAKFLADCGITGDLCPTSAKR